jgi:hypothetical protein
MSVYIAILQGYPVAAQSWPSLLSEIKKVCHIPGLAEATELTSKVQWHYGSDTLGAKIGGHWQPIGTLYHREKIPD